MDYLLEAWVEIDPGSFCKVGIMCLGQLFHAYQGALENAHGLVTFIFHSHCLSLLLFPLLKRSSTQPGQLSSHAALW